MWDKAALEVVGSVTVWETTHLVYYNVQRCDVTWKMYLYKYGKMDQVFVGVVVRNYLKNVM